MLYAVLVPPLPPWDDLRIALCVWREGSLVGAGTVLKLDPTTVGRRVSALEQALGIPLFMRARGWVPTAAGLRVLEAGERASESIAQAFRAAQTSQAPSGIVRITTLELIGTTVLAPALPAFQQLHPDIEVHLICTPRLLDLASEADIALRITRPGGKVGVARCIVRVAECMMAAPSFLAAQGLDAATLDHLEGLPLLSIGSQPMNRFAGLGEPRRVLRSNSATVVIEAARAGLGIALLPQSLVGSGLVVLPKLPRFDDLPVWMVAHPEVARIPRVRAAMDYFGQISLWGQRSL